MEWMNQHMFRRGDNERQGESSMILFINACVRKESRTKQLADYLIAKLNERVEEVRLEDILFPVSDEAFLQKRDELISQGRFDDPMFAPARQFAEADTIVIAAPCWDHSFPASLKQYIEQISVTGITFRYNDKGMPEGLCKGSRLYYVTTAGGVIFDKAFGYGYIDFLSRFVFGIRRVKCFTAENLDLDGADTDGIMSKAKEHIDSELSDRR